VRAVAVAREAVGPEALAEALERLHPWALSGATRTGLKARPGLLDDLRRQVGATTVTGEAAPAPEPDHVT
jgi:hypothetical protein